MDRERPARTQPWMLFAFPLAIAVPIVGGILLGGPILGIGVATLVALIIVLVAIRMEPRAPGEGVPQAPATTPIKPSPGALADEHRARRAAAQRFVVPLIIAAIGVVVVATGAGTTRIIGWGVIGVAVSVTISLMFLEVGYSEDRARAREQRGGGPDWRGGRQRHAPR